jgi:molybdopterin/thiamine biosynthesis adenylyltransferase
LISGLKTFLRKQAEDNLISWQVQQNAAVKFHCTIAEVEKEILCAALLPARYQRNLQMITIAQQKQLFHSKVVVVGAGGLGGYVLEQLARLGVGRLAVVDDDVFDEHNLNRQLFATPGNLGRAKVEVAAERIGEINPAVSLMPVKKLFCADNGMDLLHGADCVVDAVDNVTARLEMARVCQDLNIPLVHAAIAGWFGHVTTVLPGDDSLATIYKHWQGGQGVEQQLGNPSFTPAVAAGLQVCEVCKLLIGQGKVLSNRQFSFDLLTMEMNEIPLS